MPRYCKAYKLEDLRKFSKWSESAEEIEKELEDDAIVYIEETLFVTKNCLELDKKEDYIFNDITPEWEKFCKEELEFEVPDWEAESAKVREALKKMEEEKGDEEKGESETAATPEAEAGG